MIPIFDEDGRIAYALENHKADIPIEWIVSFN